jgi:hypothetical protein
MPTNKQIKFANGIIAGMNPTEAYRAAGYAATNSATAAVEAQRLLSNPNVSPIIQAGKEEARARAVWSRREAIERAQVINDKAYNELINGPFDRDIYKAWQESTLLLNDLVDVEYEKKIRRKAFEQECEPKFAPAFDEIDFSHGDVIREEKTGYDMLMTYYEMTENCPIIAEKMPDEETPENDSY